MADSIFDLADMFGYVSPFGNWQAPTGPKSLRVVLVALEFDIRDYVIRYQLLADNLRDLRAEVALLAGGPLGDFQKGQTHYLASGRTEYVLRLSRATRNRATLLPLTGHETFVLRAVCDGITAVSDEFTLSGKAAMPEAVAETVSRCDWVSPMTAAELQRLVPQATLADITKYLPGLNREFTTRKLNTCLRRVHFLAQIMAETDYLRDTVEGGSRRRDDGKDYKGRGLLQLTGAGNYAGFGAHVREHTKDKTDAYYKVGDQNFLLKGKPAAQVQADRAKVALEPYASWSAGWFWVSRNVSVNEWADKNDFIRVMAEINGGFNGYNKRLAALQKMMASLPTAYEPCRAPTTYKIEESSIWLDDYKTPEGQKINDEERWTVKYLFAWAIWHDPGIKDPKKNGCTPSAEQAVKAYERVIAIVDDRHQQIRTLYDIAEMPAFKDVPSSATRSFQGLFR